MSNSLHFAGNDLQLSPEDLDANLQDALKACSGPGDATMSVIELMRCFTVTGDKADCAKYLTQYGAWDEFELTDHNANLERLVWLAGCDLAENGEVYFSTY